MESLSLSQALVQAICNVYNTATHTLVKQIPIGTGAAGILMQADANRAYIACGPDDYLAVIDLNTLTVTAHINTGGEPDGLALANEQ